MESALSIKGQATIPKAIREHLQLRAGDRIKFFKHPDGTVVILPKLHTSTLRGIVSTGSRPPVSIEDMHKAVAAGVVAKYKGRNRR